MRAARVVVLVGLVGCTDRALELPSGDADLAHGPVDDGASPAVDLAANVDLRGVDLSGVDLSVLDLAGVDLAGSCGDNDVYVGTACVKRSCQFGDNRLDCKLSDGTIGHCVNVECTKIDLLSDPNNCGTRGMVCPGGTPCTNGYCYGACGVASCPAGLVCSEYGCALPSCDGAHDYQACFYVYTQPDFAAQCCGKTCAHLYSDNKNCGYCGHVCPGNAPCYYGVCDVDCTKAIDDAPCGSGTGYCCHGACVEYGIGCGCGVSCFSDCFTKPCAAGRTCVTYGFGPMAVCALDSCSGLPSGTVCAVEDADGVPQGGNCCAGGCADLANDAHNCGACGRSCRAGEICLRGNCVPPVACDQTSDGSLCRLASGVQGLCCGGACVDVHTDAQNCNGCGLACPAGASCHGWAGVYNYQGRCEDSLGAPVGCDASTPCPSGWSCAYGGLCMPTDCAGRADGTRCSGGECCSGACVSLSALDNCGSCGRACPQGTTLCSGGACLSSYFNNFSCGDKAPCPDGNVCIAATCPGYPGGCAPHQCFPPSCAGRDDGVACAFGPDGPGTCCAGACVSTARDPSNCGQCGRVCKSGLCAKSLCDTSAETRCVPDCPTGTLCYQVGPFDGGSPIGVCVGPVCGLITYNNPQLNSGRCLAQDGALGVCCADGTCADPEHDRHNCGGCGIDCGAAACVGGACAGAACDYAHQGGFCGAPGDTAHVCCGAGCVDVSSDPAHCGACGHACAAGQSCQSGTCT
jgi:hypothetical protein